jgi:hypothetical protein
MGNLLLFIRSVMVPALRYLKGLVVAFAENTIDESVLASDTPGPPALQVIFKGLRFPEPLKRVALDVSYEITNAI